MFEQIYAYCKSSPLSAIRSHSGLWMPSKIEGRFETVAMSESLSLELCSLWLRTRMLNIFLTFCGRCNTINIIYVSLSFWPPANIVAINCSKAINDSLRAEHRARDSKADSFFKQYWKDVKFSFSWDCEILMSTWGDASCWNMFYWASTNSSSIRNRPRTLQWLNKSTVLLRCVPSFSLPEHLWFLTTMTNTIPDYGPLGYWRTAWIHLKVQKHDKVQAITPFKNLRVETLRVSFCKWNTSALKAVRSRCYPNDDIGNSKKDTSMNG